MKQEAPARPTMFISLHFSSLPFFSSCDIQKKSYKQNLHFICTAAHCFLPSFSPPLILYQPPSPPNFFLSCTFSRVLCGQSRDLWLGKQQMGIFSKKIKNNNEKKIEITSPSANNLLLERPHTLTRAHESNRRGAPAAGSATTYCWSWSECVAARREVFQSRAAAFLDGMSGGRHDGAAPDRRICKGKQ